MTGDHAVRVSEPAAEQLISEVTDKGFGRPRDGGIGVDDRDCEGGRRAGECSRRARASTSLATMSTFPAVRVVRGPTYARVEPDSFAVGGRYVDGESERRCETVVLASATASRDGVDVDSAAIYRPGYG